MALFSEFAERVLSFSPVRPDLAFVVVFDILLRPRRQPDVRHETALHLVVPGAGDMHQLLSCTSVHLFPRYQDPPSL